MAPTSARSAWSATLRLIALALASALTTARCAKSACDLNSDCAAPSFCVAHQCRVDCVEDRDCLANAFCNQDTGRCQSTDADAAAPKDVATTPDVSVDVRVEAGSDAGSADAGFDVPPLVDAGFDAGSPVDLGTPDTGPLPGRGAFLDACSTNADCASGQCLTTTGGARFCTRLCAVNRDCADGFVCESPPAGMPARCVLDDTGLPCDSHTGSPCARFCIGNPVTGLAAHCTRECNTGADCPAGYACELADATHRVCVSIEQPCARAADCTTNLCVGVGAFQGCTSQCTVDSDCPRRMTINVTGVGRFTLPPYRCQLSNGMRLCVPPLAPSGDLTASEPLGAACPSTGDSPCRSGVCDGMSNTCVQGCTPAGGCPSGFSCKPWIDDVDTYLVCRPIPSGRVAVNGACTVAADCVTGLCYGTTDAYCSRFCNDGLCPTGMRCVPLGNAYDGTPIAICQR